MGWNVVGWKEGASEAEERGGGAENEPKPASKSLLGTIDAGAGESAGAGAEVIPSEKDELKVGRGSEDAAASNPPKSDDQAVC